MTFSGRSKKLVNGMVLQRNGRTRAFVVPNQPNTTAQSKVKAWFSTITAAFALLTIEIQGRWNDAATGGAWKLNDKKTGTQRNPTSGKELFQHLNMNIAAARQSTAAGQLTEVPAKEEVGTSYISAFDISNLETEVGVSFTVTGTFTANEVWIVEMSGGLSSGTSKLRESALRFVKKGTGAISVNAEYLAQFGVPAVDSRVCYRVLAVNQNTGQSRIVGEGINDVYEG